MNNSRVCNSQVGQKAHIHTTVHKHMLIVQWEICMDHSGRKGGVFEIRNVYCVGMTGVWALPY